MDFEALHDIETEGVSPPEPDSVSSFLQPPPVAIVPALALTLAACGGESSTGASAGTPPPPPAPAPSPPPPPPPTATQSARFLAQATMGTTDADIKSVVAQGYDGWLGTQFNKPRDTKFWDWLIANGYNIPSNVFSKEIDAMVWSSLISGSDQLRQRVGLSLMSILVIGVNSLPAYWVQFAMANYLDILWDNAFGNYRVLLEKISRNLALSHYLTFLESKKSNALGSIPDENYAREIMQLFSIGLFELNLDGTQKLVNNRPVETYKLSDVSGLARVFTGWHEGNYERLNPEVVRFENVIEPSEHEMGTKTFLGTTIPAGTDGVTSLKLALDAIFAHPNVAPFVSKQLIQHLVTSNPSPAYVQRVASKFENNGSGVRGDLREVVRAILLDTEARDDAAAAASSSFGKLREPVLRFTGWARAFGATSPSNNWATGNTESQGYGLGQAIGRSPTVFNWFRPGYVLPGSATAAAGKVAPEFQLTNEVSVIGYINFMMATVRDGWGDFKGNFTEFIAIAGDSQALLNLVNLRVAANQISAATIAQFKPAIDSYPAVSANDLQNRVMTATILIMASPEYLVLK
jgi:uncharacterized protein (DUF1800 family)